MVKDGTVKGKTTVEIYDVLGNLKYYNSFDMDQQLASIAIPEVADFMAGTYSLIIQNQEHIYTFQLVKVRE